MGPMNSSDPGWQNWSGSVSCEPHRIERPSDEQAVASRVAEAAGSGRSIRVVGTGHSHSPLVATEGLLLSLDDLAGVESHDRAGLFATVRAGTKLCDLGDPLLERGLAMRNLGDIDKQALAGAVSTGTHGTGRTLGNISSSVVGARLVDAAGEIRSFGMEAEEADPDRLRGLRVSLGSLGVFTALRLQLLPAYRLHERIRRMPIEDCLARIDSEIRDNRHFEFFWLPGRDVAEMKTLNLTDEPPSDLPDAAYERIGWSPHIITSVRDVKHFEMEYSVPAADGPECFRAVRARMQERHPAVQWPVEYRTVAPDDAWLSNAHGRETVTISVHQDGTLPYRDFFRDIEPIFATCGGRPHWGKIHTLTAGSLRDIYPEWDRFQALREQLDPEGRFLNAHLRELFGV
jgi:FAD/FMN-containing dehydrogenase